MGVSRFSFDGGVDGVRGAAARAAAAAVAAGVSRSRAPAFELAIHEALANALEHGHLGVPGIPIDVEVAASTGGHVTVRVADTARGGDWDPAPRAPTPPLAERGRGTALLAAGVDRWWVERGDGRTVVVLQVAADGHG